MPKFFHIPKPKQFDYRPRYYDPEKEEWERRRAELRGERTPEGEYVPGDLLRRRRMQRMFEADERRARARKKQRSTLSMILLLIVLGMAVAWVVS